MDNRDRSILTVTARPSAQPPNKSGATGRPTSSAGNVNPVAMLRKARRAGVRGIIQKVMDELQFRADTFPGLDYQPLPWIGLHNARRSAGTEERWQAIEGALSTHNITSALDIGSQVGYFCIAFALKGVPTLGVEVNDRYIRIARYAARKIKCQKAAFCKMEVSTETVALLPNVDVVLLLSVWHHWVRRNGLENASELLSEVWDKCRGALFFETGEVETANHENPPYMQPSSDEWVRGYLRDTCRHSLVHNIGQTKAFVLGDDGTKKIVSRNLYMIERQ